MPVTSFTPANIGVCSRSRCSRIPVRRTFTHNSVVVVLWVGEEKTVIVGCSSTIWVMWLNSELSDSVRENACNLSKNVKTVKKPDLLVKQPLVTQLPEVGTGKSRLPTSNILLRSVDPRNYATENCVW